MTRFLLIVLFAVPLCASSVHSRGEDDFHRLDLKTPEDLRALLHYDGQDMPLLSSHRGGAAPGYPENCVATFERTIENAFSLL